jgi:hypothetical protein
MLTNTVLLENSNPDRMFLHSEEVLSELSLNAFPNPVKDELNVAIKGLDHETNLDILDMSGIIKGSIRAGVSGNFTIGVSRLKNGVYLLRLQGSGLAPVRFIKIE